MLVTFPAQDSCTDVYSPTILQDPSDSFYHLWVGGWQNCADYGDDKIYHGTSTDLVTWTFDSQAVISDGNTAGIHYNDPTVVILPNTGAGPSQVFVMYMTECVNSPSPDCFDPGGNVTYGATSFDGTTWSTPSPVIGTNNGYNNLGAWSPSAILTTVGGQSTLYLYYNDSSGDLLRTTIDPSGDVFAPIATDLISGPFYANVSISQTSNGTYELLYNAGATFEISRDISTDGLTFLPDPTFAAISGASLAPPYNALTPFEYLVDPTHYWLYFGWGPAGATQGTTQQWYDTRALAR